MKKYRVIIIPDSDYEYRFENVGSYKEAEEILNSHPHMGKRYTFKTEKCMQMFIKGYEAGVGYLGSGLVFKEAEKMEEL